MSKRSPAVILAAVFLLCAGGGAGAQGVTPQTLLPGAVWGTVVMADSGFILWFENWSLANLPKWASDVATVVHLYEAILASLAIVVWHFYFVMLDPLVYPMDTAWLTGREAPGRALERTAAMSEPPAEKPRRG